MLSRVGLVLSLIFVGGVAHNPCMCRLLAEQTGAVPGETLFVPQEPDMTEALDVALWCESLTSD